MKSAGILAVFVVLALLSAACNVLSSSEATPAPPVPSAATAPAPTAASKPSGGGSTNACQSRLLGQVTNTATKQSPANATIELSGKGNTFKTVTDKSGLYGFAGLCAGDYAITLTPPGGKPMPNINRATLDGTNPLRLNITY